VLKNSEIEKERKAREERREKISPPMDPVVVSEVVVTVLQWWVHTARGWPHLLLYPLGKCLIVSQKFSPNESVGMHRVLVVSHPLTQ